VGRKEATGKDHEPGQDQHQDLGESHGKACGHQQNSAEQYVPPAEPLCQASGPAGAHRPGEVGKEDQADNRGGEAEWLTGESESQVVVYGHEAAHQQERLHVEGEQSRVTEMPGQRPARSAQAAGLGGAETPGLGH
jgi:hypothetical protein